MEFQISGALDEGDDAVLGMGTHIVHRSQAGKINGSIREASKILIVIIGDDEPHLLSHLLCEIDSQRLSLYHGETIGTECENDWLVCGRQGHSSKNAKQGQNSDSIVQSHVRTSFLSKKLFS